MRSKGCVQQAAPAEASPPKYHRDIRFSDLTFWFDIVKKNRLRLR